MKTLNGGLLLRFEREREREREKEKEKIFFVVELFIGGKKSLLLRGK